VVCFPAILGQFWPPAENHGNSIQILASQRLSFSRFHGSVCVVARRILQTLTHGEQTMTNHGQTTNDAILRDAFRKMNPHQAQEIRDAFYKAIEGLHTLAEMLEIADAEQETTAGSGSE